MKTKILVFLLSSKGKNFGILNGYYFCQAEEKSLVFLLKFLCQVKEKSLVFLREHSNVLCQVKEKIFGIFKRNIIFCVKQRKKLWYFRSKKYAQMFSGRIGYSFSLLTASFFFARSSLHISGVLHSSI